MLKAIRTKTEDIAMKKSSLSALLKNRLFKRILPVLGIALTVAFLPADGYGFTYRDVQNFLDSHPAPAGCYNWTEAYTSNGQQGIKVWKRCAENTIAYTEGWAEGTIYSPTVADWYVYRCDGSGLTFWTPNGNPLPAYKAAYNWYVRHYCDGRVEQTPKQQNPPDDFFWMITPLCNWTRIQFSDCRDYDALLADFFPLCPEGDPCCGNPCCDAPECCDAPPDQGQPSLLSNLPGNAAFLSAGGGGGGGGSNCGCGGSGSSSGGPPTIGE